MVSDDERLGNRGLGCALVVLLAIGYVGFAVIDVALHGFFGPPHFTHAAGTAVHIGAGVLAAWWGVLLVGALANRFRSFPPDLRIALVVAAVAWVIAVIAFMIGADALG